MRSFDYRPQKEEAALLLSIETKTDCGETPHPRTEKQGERRAEVITSRPGFDFGLVFPPSGGEWLPQEA